MAASAVGYIMLTFRVYREGKQFVGECLELGTASCGDTIEEALDNIRDATSLYLSVIEEEGERERIFRERGILVIVGEPSDTELVVRARPNEVISPYLARVPASV